MTSQSIRPEILETVRRCVADSLAIAPDELQLTSRLTDDLGADSLDFVDIIFMLERELGIKVRETELSFLTRLDYSSPAVMREGFLMPEVIEKLSAWLPAIDNVPDKARVAPRALFSLITIESVCIIAQRRIDVDRAK